MPPSSFCPHPPAQPSSGVYQARYPLSAVWKQLKKTLHFFLSQVKKFWRRLKVEVAVVRPARNSASLIHLPFIIILLYFGVFFPNFWAESWLPWRAADAMKGTRVHVSPCFRSTPPCSKQRCWTGSAGSSMPIYRHKAPKHWSCFTQHWVKSWSFCLGQIFYHLKCLLFVVFLRLINCGSQFNLVSVQR